MYKRQFLNRTTKGFELRAVGFNQYAAEFAGINVKKNTIIAMFIAGGIAALAGAIHILGTNPFRISVLPITEGYGWDGISDVYKRQARDACAAVAAHILRLGIVAVGAGDVARLKENRGAAARSIDRAEGDDAVDRRC